MPTHWLGALAASFAIVPLVLAVPSGHAVDRFGERRVMVVGSLLVLLSSAAFVLLADSVGGIVLASVVLGLGHLCSVVGQQAMVANGTPRERYDTAFGHYTFATSVGQAVGPGLIVLFGGEATIPRTSDIFLWATGADRRARRPVPAAPAHPWPRRARCAARAARSGTCSASPAWSGRSR